ncbi:hypothetical protein [Halomarina litorea]|uniref:hypothetical protein n=1 Tax=Halomarina litorea TaxID=2961595 RepID=UPI0020C32F23|nr:hypothetical protein [Halomarina sp. BCD28]
MADPDPSTLAARLHEHLAATAERPVERSASRWLGEAEAVAADAAREDASPAVVEKRVGQVRDLLSHVDGTGDPEADNHVAAARDLAARVLDGWSGE